MKEMNGRINELQSQIDRLNIDLQNKQAELDHANQTNQILRDKILELEARIEQLLAQIEDMKHKINSQQNEITVLN